MSDADQFLSGVGAPSLKFENPGDNHGGTILSWEMGQQTDLKSGDLKFWPDGKPKMQLIVTLQCEATGYSLEWNGRGFDKKMISDDDGVRRLFVKGNLQAAIGKSMREAGNAKLEVGAYLDVARGKDIPPTQKGYSAQHTFAAKWTPANQNAHMASALLSEDEESPF